MKLKAEAEYVCRTPVSCFELSYERFESIMNHRADLKMAKEDLEKVLFEKQKLPIALDYVFHNNATNPDDFEITLKKNEQKVRLKNAIMQVWSVIKKETQPKNLKTVMQERRELEKKKLERLGLQPQVEENEKSEAELLIADSQTSYFTLDQYTTLNKRITDAHYRMKEQQMVIDRLDKSMGAMTQGVHAKS